MNLQTLLFAMTMFIGAPLASAGAEPACPQCAIFNRLTVQLGNNAPDALDAAKARMQDLRFSKDKELRALEADAYVRMSLAAIRADESTKTMEASDYFAGAYGDYKQDLDTSMARLKPADRAYLEKTRRASERNLRKGNG